jgi:hypothetical protein
VQTCCREVVREVGRRRRFEWRGRNFGSKKFSESAKKAEIDIALYTRLPWK